MASGHAWTSSGSGVYRRTTLRGCMQYTKRHRQVLPIYASPLCCPVGSFIPSLLLLCCHTSPPAATFSCVSWPARSIRFVSRVAGMIDTRHPQCQDKQCTKQPSFGLEVRYVVETGCWHQSTLSSVKSRSLGVSWLKYVNFRRFCEGDASSMVHGCMATTNQCCAFGVFSISSRERIILQGRCGLSNALPMW